MEEAREKVAGVFFFLPSFSFFLSLSCLVRAFDSEEERDGGFDFPSNVQTCCLPVIGICIVNAFWACFCYLDSHVFIHTAIA